MASMKKTVVCFDRDGTLIYGDKYHLGSTNNWKPRLENEVGEEEKVKRIQGKTYVARDFMDALTYVRKRCL